MRISIVVVGSRVRGADRQGQKRKSTEGNLSVVVALMSVAGGNEDEERDSGLQDTGG